MQKRNNDMEKNRQNDQQRLKKQSIERTTDRMKFIIERTKDR